MHITRQDVPSNEGGEDFKNKMGKMYPKGDRHTLENPVKQG